jgi:hypothetical protein
VRDQLTTEYLSFFVQMDDIEELLCDIEQLQNEINKLHDSWKRNVHTDLLLRIFAMMVLWQWCKLKRFMMFIQQGTFQVQGIDLLAIVYVAYLLRKYQI